ncbi:MAG TPA: TIGR02300 family protein [Rhodospirillaceae bacterium]|nr:TIGR02300 family protein [Rhodospirillaceae bacterium]
MAKPEWGVKRACHSCGAHFYDLMRQPIICPKCKAVVEPELAFKPRRQAASEAKAALAKNVPAALAEAPLAGALAGDDLEIIEDEDADIDAIDGGEDDESGLIEDASDLGEDDDDMAEVMEHLDEDIEGEL